MSGSDDSERIGHFSMGSVLVSLGKLEAKVEEAASQRDKVFKQNEEQKNLILGMREEMRIGNGALSAMLASHDARLARIEPLVINHENHFQQNKGTMKGMAIGAAAGGGGFALAVQAVLKKIGWL